jgi:hypothetical protein
MDRPSDRVNETLGQYLKQMRESRRISVDQLSRGTRISPAFILALEENNFGFFSQPEQIPGYLQLYARDMGLDYADILSRYQMQPVLRREESEAPRSRILRRYVNTPIRAAADAMPPFLNRPRMSSGRLVALCLIPVALILIGLMVAPVADPFSMLVSSISALRQKDAAHQSDRADRRSLAEGMKEAVHLTPGLVNSGQLPSPKTLQERDLPATSEIKGGISQETSETPQNQEKWIVVGNRDTRRYHLAGMKYYEKVDAYHRVEFESEDAAIKAGYHKAPR